MLSIKFKNTYVSKIGTVHTYIVKCKKKEKESFKAIMGDLYKENDKGQPLFFSKRKMLVGTLEAYTSPNGRIMFRAVETAG